MTRLTQFGILSLSLAALTPASIAADVDIKAAAAKVSQIIAHRGASAERPECTLASNARAAEVGATAAEIDVRTSKDGRLFLLHDTTLDRTTNGKGLANALTLAELQRLDAGSHFDPEFRGEKIPSLVEAARVAKDKIGLLLDLKEQGDAYDRQVVRVIREHGEPARTIVGVRSVAQAKRFRELLPEATQLALIPTVNDIEAFAEAGVDFIRLWPRWLAEGDAPVKRVRATGAKLHLNGTTGGREETLGLLAYRPNSLSSDDPKRQKATLKRIAAGDAPNKRLDALIDKIQGARTTLSESDPGARTFLNRDYEMLELPRELVGLPRFAFDGGAGGSLQCRFKQPTVVFAAFDYNDTGSWTFADGRSPAKHGWHLWREDGYRGSSNPKKKDGSPWRASIWFREHKKGQALSGLPEWWVCLGVADLPAAQKIDGFKEGLVSNTPPPPRIYSHPMAVAQTRPLNIPTLDSAEAIRSWQTKRRKAFVDRMLFPYAGNIETVAAEKTEDAKFERQEFEVTLDGERLFRYFRLEPTGSPPLIRPTIVCFMGHGKVTQILEDSNSYQHACAAEFAKAGYLVFAMENVGMETSKDTHLDLDQALRLEARGWYSLLFAHQRILLDAVFVDPGVDPKRVGVTGVSTGGLLALSAAAMEPRIAASSVQGIFGSMRVSFIRDRNRHCKCGAIPGLLPDFDLPELALLVAPRALHISNGERDGFSPDEAERCLKLIEPIYLKAGGKKPRFDVPPGGHAFALKPALEFFGDALRK
jgi:glycerophosphoryl diester phosphodiesterase